MIETVRHEGELLAIIIPGDFRESGVQFFTPPALSQQLAFMSHPAGKLIAPHVHNPVQREVQFTHEVLVIRRGILRVDFYDAEQAYLHSRLLHGGDVILLAAGGHGFEVVEDVEMIEVKQGPFAGEQDKTRFAGVPDAQIRVLEGNA